ncbi:TatD family hydrolase [Candidatus Saccharibacteria bacterium]|nr:TatD family hydrolase [Candidatus Saccharibacteria bacterium]
MALELFDTHCHVHEVLEHLTPVHDKWHSDGTERTAESILAGAHTAGVTGMLVIGTTLADSELAVRFAQEHEGVWASIGIHPHEAKDHRTDDIKTQFAALATHDKVVAVGECGLDYFYGHSPKEDQLDVLRFQLDLATRHDLPLSFHVREAFDDFWPVFDEYTSVRGVLHSFTDSEANMRRAVEHGLYIGVNGIATFTKDDAQLVIYRTIPQHHIVLETDAPFLTPKPFRGTVCEPKHVVNTAEFLANLRGEDLAELAAATTTNARTLLQV